jgi:hypothetical protein
MIVEDLIDLLGRTSGTPLLDPHLHGIDVGERLGPKSRSCGLSLSFTHTACALLWRDAQARYLARVVTLTQGTRSVPIVDDRELYHWRQGVVTTLLGQKHSHRAGPTIVVLHNGQILLSLPVDAAMLRLTLNTFFLPLNAIFHC